MPHPKHLQSEFACLECYKDYPLLKMVIIPNSLWLTIAGTHDHLCSDCIEHRLGRGLSPEDFPDKRIAVYRGQRENLRTIPVNQLYFKTRGWDLPVRRKSTKDNT